MTETTERAQGARADGSPLVTGRGRTTIKDAVVSSIASEAVTEASGAEPEIAGRTGSIPSDNSPPWASSLAG